MLRPHSGAIEGLSCKEMVGRLSADLYFVSGNGFSPESGLSGDNFYELELKRLCAERAKKIVALIDSTKLGTDSASSFIPAYKIEYLITDSGASEEEVAHCREKGLNVIVAEA
jgi:DeoR family transcriptional regulator of aga operon